VGTNSKAKSIIKNRNEAGSIVESIKQEDKEKEESNNKKM
jgi:hypothetical protein